MTKLQATWPAGPWDAEPDHEEWILRGIKCEVKRHPEMGHLCGYVTLPEGHPWAADESAPLDVHGGVTYSHERQLGWDYAHCNDLSPGLQRHREPSHVFPERYHPWAEVRADVEKAAYAVFVAAEKKDFATNKAKMLIDGLKKKVARTMLLRLMADKTVSPETMIATLMESGAVQVLPCCGQPVGWCVCEPS